MTIKTIKAFVRAQGAALKEMKHSVPNSVLLHATAAAVGKTNWHVLRQCADAGDLPASPAEQFLAQISRLKVWDYDGMNECAEPSEGFLDSHGSLMDLILEARKILAADRSSKTTQAAPVSAEPPAGDAFQIPAEIHSDDRAVEVRFDALAWLEQASILELRDLAHCGFRGDYGSDAVGEWMSAHNAEVEGVFQYLSIIHKSRQGRDVGFEVSVEPLPALRWILEHRPAVALDAEQLGRRGIDLEEARKSRIDKPGAQVQQERSKAADAAFAAYDFRGAGIEEVDGWEYTTPGVEMSRVFYVENEDGCDSTKCYFTVRFAAETSAEVIEAYAMGQFGNRFGQMPAGD